MDSTQWDQRYAGAELVWSKGPNQFVEAFAADLSPGRALDVAAGEGRNAIWLAERGWDVTATDFSQVAVERTLAIGRERLGERVGPRRQEPQTPHDRQDRLDRHDQHEPSGAPHTGWLEAHVSDATAEHPQQHGAYDLVVVCYLQLVSAQRHLALHEAARAVAPGGRAIFVAHDSRNIAEGVGGPQDPDVLYGPQDIIADLDGLGLVIDRAETVPRRVEVDGESRDALDALVTVHRE